MCTPGHSKSHTRTRTHTHTHTHTPQHTHTHTPSRTKTHRHTYTYITHTHARAVHTHGTNTRTVACTHTHCHTCAHSSFQTRTSTTASHTYVTHRHIHTRIRTRTHAPHTRHSHTHTHTHTRTHTHRYPHCHVHVHTHTRMHTRHAHIRHTHTRAHIDPVSCARLACEQAATSTALSYLHRDAPTLGLGGDRFRKTCLAVRVTRGSGVLLLARVREDEKPQEDTGWWRFATHSQNTRAKQTCNHTDNTSLIPNGNDGGGASSIKQLDRVLCGDGCVRLHSTRKITGQARAVCRIKRAALHVA